MVNRTVVRYAYAVTISIDTKAEAYLKIKVSHLIFLMKNKKVSLRIVVNVAGQKICRQRTIKIKGVNDRIHVVCHFTVRSYLSYNVGLI